MDDSAPRLPRVPLPAAPFRPGRGSAPPRHDGGLSDDERFAHGADLFDAGFWWEAHEAWEPLWAAASGAEREALQGLIQAAAHLLKRGEGGAEAAADRLRDRAIARLTRWVDARGPRFRGQDLEALRDALLRGDERVRLRALGPWTSEVP